MAAIEGLPRFRGPVEALGGWLFQIARHDLLEFRRQQARSRTAPPEEPKAQEAPERVLAELFAGLAARSDLLGGSPLSRLSPREREVLILRMLGGLAAPEVAEVLGKTTGAVKALQHRGLANLSRVLGLRERLPPSDRPINMGEGPRRAGSGSPRSAWGGGSGWAS